MVKGFIIIPVALKETSTVILIESVGTAAIKMKKNVEFIELIKAQRSNFI